MSPTQPPAQPNVQDAGETKEMWRCHRWGKRVRRVATRQITLLSIAYCLLATAYFPLASRCAPHSSLPVTEASLGALTVFRFVLVSRPPRDVSFALRAIHRVTMFPRFTRVSPNLKTN